MSSYTIHTLFGEAPDGSVGEVQVAVPTGLFEEKKWRLVVERVGKHGESLQKDITQGLDLLQAMQHREEMALVYASDGWTPRESGVHFQNPVNGQSVYLYVDVETR